MLKAYLALVLLCAVPALAQAKTFKLGENQPVVALTIPPDWETASADSGVEATVPNTYFSGEVIDADDLPEATTATEQFLVERKINLKTQTKTQKATSVAGLPATENNWEATDADGPTRVRVTIIKITNDKLLLTFYWRSEAGEKAHGGEVDYIMNSIKPIK